MKTITSHPTETDLQRAVLQELAWDPKVDETDVGVQVKDGVITLVGTIDSYAKKQAACDAAHRVAGVLDVVNEIEVQIPSPWVRPDTEIAHAVRLALVWDTYAPDDRIKSTVTKGWVTLEGDVEYAYQSEEAERVVERLNGVRGVTNSLVVKGQAVGAREMRASILDALSRHTQREARHLDIQVKDGIVSLAGKVDSWGESRIVESVVRRAPGVRGIVNRLVVDGAL